MAIEDRIRDSLADRLPRDQLLREARRVPVSDVIVPYGIDGLSDAYVAVRHEGGFVNLAYFRGAMEVRPSQYGWSTVAEIVRNRISADDADQLDGFLDEVCADIVATSAALLEAQPRPSDIRVDFARALSMAALVDVVLRDHSPTGSVAYEVAEA